MKEEKQQPNKRIKFASANKQVSVNILLINKTGMLQHTSPEFTTEAFFRKSIAIV